MWRRAINNKSATLEVLLSKDMHQGKQKEYMLLVTENEDNI